MLRKRTRWFFIFFILLAVLLCSSVLATIGAEDVTSWNLNFTGSATGNDGAYSVAVDGNGNVYAVGYGTNLVTGSSNTDWWIKKFDSSGTEDTTSWNKTFTAAGLDSARSVAVDSSDNVYVVGYGQNIVTGSSSYDWWIKKFDSSGTEDTIAWNKTFSSTGGADEAYSVAVDSSDNVYVVGYGTSLRGTSGKDWWIKKFDSSGTENTTAWNKNFTSSGNAADVAQAVAVDSADNVYVAGYGKNLAGSTGLDFWIKKFDSSGTENTTAWNKNFTGPANYYDYVEDIAVDSADNVYVAGYGRHLVSGSSYDDWWVKKFDSSGTENTTAWNKNFTSTGSTNDIAWGIMVDSADNVYVVGDAYRLTSGASSYDWWVKKFDSSGNENTTRWNKNFTGTATGSDVAYAVAANGNKVYVVGYGQNLASGSSNYDWWIKKFQGSLVQSQPITTSFASGTTNFSLVDDLYAVSGMVLAQSTTQVRWTGVVNAAAQNYDDYVAMGNGFVSLNLSGLDSSINSTAVVNLSVSCDSFTLYYATGFHSTLASLLAAGTPVATQANLGGNCNDASICTSLTCSGGVLTFTAQHFDGFGGGGGAAAVPELGTWLALFLALGLVMAGIARLRQR